MKNDPGRADRQGARVRVTCRGLSGNFLSWWHVLHNSIQCITYIKVNNVGRLNYVYTDKYSTFTNMKVNSVHNPPYKKPVQSFPETRVVDTSARGSRSPIGVCRATFCQGDILHNIIPYITYIKGINVGRLNYVCICKYSAFNSTLKPTVYVTQRTKYHTQLFPETDVVDKSVYGGSVPTGLCRANFCHRDIFYTTLCLHTIHKRK